MAKKYKRYSEAEVANLVAPSPVGVPEPPKQTTYQGLERKAVLFGAARLEESTPDWKRLRRSAGFTD